MFRLKYCTLTCNPFTQHLEGIRTFKTNVSPTTVTSLPVPDEPSKLQYKSHKKSRTSPPFLQIGLQKQDFMKELAPRRHRLAVNTGPPARARHPRVPRNVIKALRVTGSCGYEALGVTTKTHAKALARDETSRSAVELC